MRASSVPLAILAVLPVLRASSLTSLATGFEPGVGCGARNEIRRSKPFTPLKPCSFREIPWSGKFQMPVVKFTHNWFATLGIGCGTRSFTIVKNNVHIVTLVGTTALNPVNRHHHNSTAHRSNTPQRIMGGKIGIRIPKQWSNGPRQSNRRTWNKCWSHCHDLESIPVVPSGFSCRGQGQLHTFAPNMLKI